MDLTSFLAGIGTTCTPTSALDALAGMYVTDGPSKIACTEGSNVAQPPGSPGWVDDPTGSVAGDPKHAVGHLLMPLYLMHTCSMLP